MLKTLKMSEVLAMEDVIHCYDFEVVLLETAEGHCIGGPFNQVCKWSAAQLGTNKSSDSKGLGNAVAIYR